MEEIRMMDTVTRLPGRLTGWLPLVACALALAACGDGSGRSSADDEPATLSWNESNWNDAVWE
jgi:hypothetical protein